MENPGPSAAPSFFRRALLPRVFFALLLFSVLGAYWPARVRFFGGDQFSYFAELRGDRSLAAGMRLLDYNALRQFNKGDELLYRPLFFAWLAVQNSAFGLDVRGWNLANLACHLFAAWLLFEALWRLHRSIFAHAFALGFALLAANFELVTWNHLGGYMLGYGLLLAAAMAAREALVRDRPAAWGVYFFAMASAMLFHEIAVLAAILAPLFSIPYLRRHRGGARATALAALLVPLAVYFALYAFHVARCARWLWMDVGQGPRPSLWWWVLQLPAAGWTWAVRILFPATFEYVVQLTGRSFWTTPPRAYLRADFFLQLGLWAAVAFSLRRAVSRTRLKVEKGFAGAIAAVLAAYVAMNCAGRWYVLQVSYYPYFFALFGTLGVAALLDFPRVGKRGRAVALAALAALAAFNGLKVLRASRQIERNDAPLSRFYAAVDRGVRPRLQDPSFTFGIRNVPPQFDYRTALVVGYPGSGREIQTTVMKILYGPAYNPFLPAAWLVLE